MSDVVIQVDQLSKLYQIGVKQSGSVRDMLAGIFSGQQKQAKADFWALKEISFEVNRGDVLGVVGRNGAGKSTLLKVLSRITEPTDGSMAIQGRVGSLLEVGTGFHPELSGRENVFLNGSILGMKKAEIKAKFDEIVDFSGVEKFIDTPVKRYSSGMYVRLAFAVAAHLEPEILIIDEVLAVGDVAFQKKCLGKMKDVAGQGRTVLFVSHNMQAVRNLCTRAIYLKEGKLIAQGQTNDVLYEYDKHLLDREFGADTDVNSELNRRGSGACRYTKIVFYNILNVETNSFDVTEDIRIELEFKVIEPTSKIFAALALRSGLNREIITTSRHQLPFTNLKPGELYSFSLLLPKQTLRPGEYPVYMGLGTEDFRPIDIVDDITAPLIISSTNDAIILGYDPSSFCGYFSLNSCLRVEKNENSINL